MSFPNFTTKDYLVSQEEFQLIYDSELDMYKTSPVPNNLGRYYESENYISHTDSTKSVIDYLYSYVKIFTLTSKLNLIQQYAQQEKSLLDMGAGTGDFLAIANKNQWTIEGVEPNENARTIAKKKEISLHSTLEEITNQFEVITLWHVLEHLPNLEKDIHQIKSKLKKDGTLIIAVPNFKSYDAEYYKEYWAAYDTPRHLWHFSQNSIKKIFRKYNLKVIETKPMYFDSFYVSLLSEKHKTRKNNYLKAFMVGLRSNIKARRTKEYSSLIYILKSDKN